MDILPPEVSDVNADSTPTNKATSKSWVSNTVRGAMVFIVLGSAAAYGAITANPKLTEYLSFIPGLDSNSSACSMSAKAIGCGGCSGATCPSISACDAASGCASESGCSSGCQGSCPSENRCPLTSSTETIAESATSVEVATETSAVADPAEAN